MDQPAPASQEVATEYRGSWVGWPSPIERGKRTCVHGGPPPQQNILFLLPGGEGGPRQAFSPDGAGRMRGLFPPEVRSVDRRLCGPRIFLLAPLLPDDGQISRSEETRTAKAADRATGSKQILRTYARRLRGPFLPFSATAICPPVTTKGRGLRGDVRVTALPAISSLLLPAAFHAPLLPPEEVRGSLQALPNFVHNGAGRDA